MAGLLDFLKGGGGENPLTRLLAPEVAMPMAGALMGGGGNMQNFGSALMAGGQALGQQKQQRQLTAQTNKTRQYFIDRGDQEYADAIDMGLSPAEAYKAFLADQKELKAQKPLINAGDGNIYDPNSKEFIKNPNAAPKPPSVVELFDEQTGQPYKATWDAQSGTYKRVGGVKARSGMQLTTNPDGTVTMTEGPLGPTGMPKLTEAEGRNSGFFGRGVESHKVITQLEEQGTSLGNKIAGGIPVFGNYMKGPEAQKYSQAQRDFINAVLRRESGAVISPEEFANAQEQYFPQPGDGPEVIAQKRANRETTIRGLEISSGQGAQFATQPPTGVEQNGGWQDLGNGVRIRPVN